jgi:arsenate reductase
MIENHPHEVIIYYHSEKPVDREILAHAASHFSHIRLVDLKTQKITGTRLEEIAMRLGVPLRRMILENPVYEEDSLEAETTSDNDYIKFIQHNPNLLRTPIVITKDKACVAKGAKDLYELVEGATN